VLFAFIPCRDKIRRLTATASDSLVRILLSNPAAKSGVVSWTSRGPRSAPARATKHGVRIGVGLCPGTVSPSLNLTFGALCLPHCPVHRSLRPLSRFCSCSAQPEKCFVNMLIETTNAYGVILRIYTYLPHLWRWVDPGSLRRQVLEEFPLQ
jgi:hypothetical protein